MKVVVNLGRYSFDVWAKKKLIAPAHRTNCEQLRHQFGKERAGNQLFSRLLIHRKPVTWERSSIVNKSSGIQPVGSNPSSAILNVLNGLPDSSEDSESEEEHAYELPEIGGVSNVDADQVFRELMTELVADEIPESEPIPGLNIHPPASEEALHSKNSITMTENPDVIPVMDLLDLTSSLTRDCVARKHSDDTKAENSVCPPPLTSVKNHVTTSEVCTKSKPLTNFPEGGGGVPQPASKNVVSSQKHSVSTVQSVQASLQSRKAAQQLKLLKHLSPQNRGNAASMRNG